MKCYDMCKNSEITCPVKSCRHWISYGEDLNCTIIAIEKNGNMTLREVSKRIGVSFVRIKQIESNAIKKVLKQILKTF